MSPSPFLFGKFISAFYLFAYFSRHRERQRESSCLLVYPQQKLGTGTELSLECRPSGIGCDVDVQSSVLTDSCAKHLPTPKPGLLHMGSHAWARSFLVLLIASLGTPLPALGPSFEEQCACSPPCRGLAISRCGEEVQCVCVGPHAVSGCGFLRLQPRAGHGRTQSQ